MGLLGGSLGLAVNRIMPSVRRMGYSHRAETRQRALEAGAVDVVFDNPAEAVKAADLVVLASPIGVFPELMKAIAPVLPAGCLVTDVGSTKVWPMKWAKKYLPKSVVYIGSHPMAGSEQRGVEFARADLFDEAYCILTPTAQTPEAALEFLRRFWQSLHMRLAQMPAAQHDRTLARISHLPHLVAAALVNSSVMDEMLLCGKGFLDTTRIASGPASVWRDIFMTNTAEVDKAITRLVKELQTVQKKLQTGQDEAIYQWLDQARDKRNELVAKKLKRKELPS